MKKKQVNETSFVAAFLKRCGSLIQCALSFIKLAMRWADWLSLHGIEQKDFEVIEKISEPLQFADCGCHDTVFVSWWFGNCHSHWWIFCCLGLLLNLNHKTLSAVGVNLKERIALMLEKFWYIQGLCCGFTTKGSAFAHKLAQLLHWIGNILPCVG